MGEEKRIKDLATASSITNSDYLAMDNGNNSASKKTSAMPLKNVQGSSDVYSSLKAYKVGDLVIQNNQLYQCNTDCAAASWSTNSGYFDAVTLASAVSELNEALTWKNGGTITTTSSQLPNDYKELYIAITAGNTDITIPLFIAKNSLTASYKRFRLGYYGVSNETGEFTINVSLTTISVGVLRLNSSDVTSSSTVNYYYR